MQVKFISLGFVIALVASVAANTAGSRAASAISKDTFSSVVRRDVALSSKRFATAVRRRNNKHEVRSAKPDVEEPDEEEPDEEEIDKKEPDEEEPEENEPEENEPEENEPKENEPEEDENEPKENEPEETEDGEKPQKRDVLKRGEHGDKGKDDKHGDDDDDDDDEEHHHETEA
ncbi:hypothetical protein G6F43_006341 [Rhizopus delemar]|nr:hypothetical protein G6F43_006341 [Rhizopus delemar]